MQTGVEEASHWTREGRRGQRGPAISVLLDDILKRTLLLSVLEVENNAISVIVIRAARPFLYSWMIYSSVLCY